MAHDLRTPLTAIYGYVDLMEKEEISQEAKRYLAFIQNRITALSQLTEELFRYSVITSTAAPPAFENLSLNTQLEESLAAYYSPLVERGIIPTITMPAEKVIRPLNPETLRRIFSNVLSNALKYSDGDLMIFLFDTGEIHFSNTAKSLDALQVEKLFNRFYTVESARKSTGLGLAIAKTLVEQMGGTITAQYQNQRLTVMIHFPLTG